MDRFAFDPTVAAWFAEKFGGPTEPQSRAWPEIAAGRHTLVAAPTGSGKTLASFLVCLDRLLHRWREGTLEDRTYVVYVSPLKALGNDIHRNLEVPLAELSRRLEESGDGPLPVRAMVRTGDTPASQRQAMLRKPPHILVTTPESLYLLLTSEKSRQTLRGVETVIVDEIHALAPDKRGSHLALTLERLVALCEKPPVRIGLSATQRPIESIARFLVGTRNVDAEGTPDCAIIDGGHSRDLDLAIEVPPSELSAVCSHEQWGEVYARLSELITAHRSTLVFVNTRRMAERVAHHLRELLGEDAVASHHGSLSREIRLTSESRLKNGQLRAIVATASLEMGIDIGYIDLVCQIGSTRSIARFLQRVGRAGHSLGKVPKGRLFPLTRDELLESLALVRAVRSGALDAITVPERPLDILAQQITASVACDEWSEDELYALMQQAWPYRELPRADFDAIVEILSEGVAPGTKRGAYLHRDRINGRLRARRGARLAAITSGGAIPETAQYRVVAEPDETFVGTVDEDFAIESLAGDVFLLGNTSWRILYVRGGEVRVRDAEGAAPSIPFWFGEGPGRTVELSEELSSLRRDLAAAVDGAGNNGSSAVDWLASECGADEWAARQALSYVETQLAAVGVVPTAEKIIFERFFDESGGMQLVIHAPLGARINRAWGLALRKRFCRSFDFELQAAADDDGIVLSLGPQHSVPIEALFKMLNTENVKYLLEQALLAVPMFQVRWRWNLTRALVVLRQQNGKRVPPHMQRFRSDDLMAAVFPETVGCLENHSGDVEIPDHPLVRQTMHDCLHEAMDIDALVEVFARVRDEQIHFIGRDTREPSPFCYELLNANPYAFLDGAPLEERRVRAVATRRTMNPDDMRDLARLDPDAVAQVRAEAWPLVRSADELHDGLEQLIVVDDAEAAPWREAVQQLVKTGRATRVGCGERSFWIAAESWPILRAAFPEAVADPPVQLPAELDRDLERTDAVVALVRGRVEYSGPTTAGEIADFLGLDEALVAASLEALEGRGTVLRGNFGDDETSDTSGGKPTGWCDRRLLARIHRMTLAGLRRQIQRVEPHVYLHFLTRFHHLSPDDQWGGPVGVREAIAQLQGFELPAGAWEARVLAARVADYDPGWLDQLFHSGEAVWGRLNPPRRDDQRRPSNAALTRVVPISLLLREELSTLLPVEPVAPSGSVRSGAEAVLEALRSRGALFFAELKSLTQLLPTQLEEALRELAACGLVSSDGFAAVRAIAKTGDGRTTRRRTRHVTHGPAAAVGRWSLFPGPVHAASREQYLEAWCRQLLRRYGVVFRDVLVREASAPAWGDLVRVLRLLELRGEVRGGRFVGGVAGEQYALPAAVDQLREARRQLVEGERPEWIVISAADPVNLFGVVTPGARVAATHRNALVIAGGRVVATRQAGVADFHEPVDSATQWAMRRAMTLGRRVRSPEEAQTTASEG
ncbi:MAG: DEAD/DEAH box helicase [Planctomycetota bacterium]|nr:MAG: DEAD/DEAH box helicase [Planctomycetota bacterium]